MKTILFISFLLFSKICFAQKFHTFCFIDNRLTTNISDRKTVTEMSEQLSKLLSISSQAPIAEDPKVAWQGVESRIKAIEKGDFVLFYFAGEGEGKKKEDEKNTERQYIFFKDIKISHDAIIQLVKKESPQFAIILIEASSKQSLINEGEFVDSHAGVVSRSNAKTLFNYKVDPKDAGTIFYMNGTEPPKPTHKNPKIGSYFLVSFRKNLFDEMGEDAPSWKRILTNVSNQVSKFTNKVQNPYGEISPIK